MRLLISFAFAITILISFQSALGATVQSPPPVTQNQSHGCILPVPSNRLFAPSIIDQETQRELVPIQNQRDRAWHIRIEKGRRIRVTCGRGNPLIDYDPYYYLLLTCVQQSEFRDKDDDLILLPEGVECSNPRKPTPIVHKNGTCSGNGSNLDVEFVTESPPRKFYSVCMDEDTSGTLYSSSYIDGGAIANGLVESGGNRPDFRGQEFYPFQIKQAYKWENAYEHLSDLLGSDTLVDRYFPEQNYRFSRGHLFPNADGIKRFEKHATFYYMNTVPQWQILNGGNWAIIEQDVRDLASRLSRTFIVTTGSYGVTTLKDENNNNVELWLARDGTGKLRLPVPRFVWKVVHDPVGSAAVAIIQVNNPWADSAKLRENIDGDILCTDLCSNLPWIRSENLHSARKGYTYCCDVQELRRVIQFVPNLEYRELLGIHLKHEESDVDSGFEDNSELDSDSESLEDDISDSSSASGNDDSVEVENHAYNLRSNSTKALLHNHNVTQSLSKLNIPRIWFTR